MDGLSVAASIAGLISLCIDVGKYLNDVKDAPKNAENLRAQLTTLEHVLQQLDTFLRGESVKGKSFDKTSVLCQAMGSCSDQLACVSERLKGAHGNILQRAKFPFREKEVAKAIESLRGCTQTFQFSLTIEGCALLSQTSGDVSTSLEIQLDTSRKLFEMTKGMATMSIFAKEALRTSNQVGDILALVSSFSETGGHVENISRGIERLENRLQDDKEKAIFAWLSNYRSMEKHHDVSARRTPGTGEWLLQHSLFKDWMKDQQKNSLICLGGPGVGKTVLTSLVVDYLINDPSRRKTGVAWYHCDYREQSSQTPAKLVGSLLRQLSLQTETVPKAVLDFYELHKNESVQPQAKDILKVLLGVSIEFARCFVVIDALDEVEKKHRKEYMKIIQELKNGSVKVFVTSRPHLHDIVTAFSGDLLIDVAADQKDIKLFLSKILEDDENMEELLDDKLRKEVLDKLSCHAGGMFLLPALQIQTIVDQVTKSDIRLALSSLSFNIHEVFESAIQRIQSQPGSRQKVAMQSLMWISYARRPLSVDELCHALATRMGDRELDKDNLIPIKTIVESCSGLVVIDHESSTVRLVHFSFQEYLQVRRKFLFPAGDSIIASICLTYASFRRLSSISSEDSVTALKYLAQDYPLLGYSYHHWGYHAKADLNMEVKELVMQFLTEPSHTLWDAFVQALSNPRYSLSSSSWAQLSEGNSLHCIARFGLFQLIPSIIQTGALPNTLDHHGNTPLHEATLFGQMEAAKVLLEHGAEIDAYNDDANTSLFIACSAGDEELIALFLKFGAEPDMPCKDGWTSLHRAAHYGHLGAVKLLLKNGASQRSKSSRGVTALHRAAGRGHNEVVDLLLQRGCEVDSMTSDSWTPLHGAASSGQHGTMSLLLARGASVNHQSQDGRTALHRACRGGYIEAVKVLLLGGADRMIADEFGMIPLHRAAKGGHPEIMHVLLDVERDLQARQLASPNHFSMTPHDVALAAGFYDHAKDLRVTPSMPQRQSELEIAVEQGDEKSLRSLLSQGADCNQPTMDGLTPFHQAILLDQHELALIMLENGANVDAPALNGWPALHSAARKGSLSSVQICLQHGAAVMSRDIRKKTPLHKACQGGNVEVVRLLLREGADPEAEDDYSWRPIHACAAAGHGDVARLLLLERDVQLDTRDISGRTPQACAARAGHHDLVEFLRTERPW